MVIIGSRGSELALYQANLIKPYLVSLGHEVEIKVITTTGDKIDYLSFDKIEGKGFFTKELESALLSHEIDIAVHSLKDLSTQMPEGLKVGAYCNPEDPSELLLINPDKYDSTQKLYIEHGATIGTSSVRRQAQIAYYRPDLKIEPLRGNVPTRIRKLREKRYDAIILAHAGVERLKLEIDDLKYFVLDKFDFIPAPGQGILAIQMRVNDTLLEPIISELNNKEAQAKAELERGLLSRFQGGCQLPLAVISEKRRGQIYLKAFLGIRDGEHWGEPVFYEGIGKNIGNLIEEAFRELSAKNKSHAEKQKKRILITRSEDESEDDLILLNYDAEIIYYPVIKVASSYDNAIVDDAVANISTYSWLIFTSKNTVRIFHDISNIESVKMPSAIKIAAVGRKTAGLLRELGYKVDMIPQMESSSGLLEEFLKIDPTNISILLPQGEEAPDTLERGLISIGFNVNRISLYKTTPRPAEQLPRILSYKIDFFIFTSPSSVKYFKTLGHSISDAAWVASIGQPTAKALEKQYRKPDYVPLKADISDIAEKIRERL